MRHGVSKPIVAIGAAVALALNLYAGRNNPSLALRLMFGAWVLAPFLLAYAAGAPKAAFLAVTAASLGIYAAETFGVLNAKLGFVFLVVPAVSLAVLAAAAAINRRRSPRAR